MRALRRRCAWSGYEASRRRCASGSDSSFLSVWFSIWRIRSRVTLNARPTSSSVRGRPPVRPKRISITSRSRCGSAASARRTFSRRRFSRGQLERRLGRLVLDEVAQLGLLLLADRLLQRDRLLGHAQDVAHLARRALELAGDLLRRRLAAELLDELALDVHDLVELLDHVDRDADRPALVGDRARHRLADPPRRVGRELVAAAVVELLDRADQPERALLDQVQERQAAAEVALGDRDDEAQVGLDHLLLGEHVAALDALGQRDLLLGRQQLDAADRAQVEAQRVEARLDREVDLGLLGRRPRRAARRSARASTFPFSDGRGLAVGTDDVDAVLVEVGVQLAAPAPS